MMLRPAVSQILKNNESYYSLVIAVAKRAREIIDGAEVYVSAKNRDNNKPVTIATQEVADEKITFRLLTQEEIDKLVKEEEAKIDAGTSPLTNPNAQLTDGGMGLGGVLLSSIAGAMIGSWLGNKLFNNQNFQNQRQTQYKSPQTYSKSQSSFTKSPATTGTSGGDKKSGFFGGNNSSTTSSSTSKSSSFSSPTTSSTGG